jgi:hypothetical protein
MVKSLSKIKYSFSLSIFTILSYVLPLSVHAQVADNPGRVLLRKLARVIINPIISVAFAVALVTFLVGIIEFISDGEKSDGRKKGRDHILWGLIGMGIMFAAFALLRLVTGTFGIDQAPINSFQSN